MIETDLFATRKKYIWTVGDALQYRRLRTSVPGHEGWINIQNDLSPDFQMTH